MFYSLRRNVIHICIYASLSGVVCYDSNFDFVSQCELGNSHELVIMSCCLATETCRKRSQKFTRTAQKNRGLVNARSDFRWNWRINQSDSVFNLCNVTVMLIVLTIIRRKFSAIANSSDKRLFRACVPNLWYMYHWWSISHCQVVHLKAQRKKKKGYNITETKCIKLREKSFAPTCHQLWLQCHVGIAFVRLVTVSSVLYLKHDNMITMNLTICIGGTIF